MKLYIRWGYLSAFRRLYDREELLQKVLKNETSFEWSFDEEFRNEIEKKLKGVKFEML